MLISSQEGIAMHHCNQYPNITLTKSQVTKQSKDLKVVIAWRKQKEYELGFHPNHGIVKP